MSVNPSEWLQVVPETGSDERMHVLDETCWCRPTLAQIPAGSKRFRRFEYQLLHRSADAASRTGGTE